MKNVFGDNRLGGILLAFCRTPTVSTSALAAKLDVSERTIRNDIKQLNQELKDCAAIEGSQGEYTLHIYHPERFGAAKARLLESDGYLNSPRNRMDYIFGRLMRAETPLLTDELAYEMNIGRSTLVNDLKKLRAETEPYRLAIVGKTSKGLLLQGSESDIRHYALEKAYDFLYQQYPLDQEILDIVAESFSSEPFEASAQASFRRFLTVMLDRFLIGHTIGELPEAFYDLTSRPEYAVIDRLIDRLAAFLRVEFPVEEKLFVLLPIAGMRTPADIRDMRSIELDQSMYQLKDRVFQRIHQDMNIQIESPDFIDEFLYHLMFMINRLKFHVRLKNAELSEIREKYPLAWQMAGIAAQVVRETYGLTVTEDEHSFLAYYFGVFLEESGAKKSRPFRAAVVCGTGRVTARLVAAQLRRVLDSSAELSLLSRETATAEVLAAFDLVFTTVDLIWQPDLPVIYIHEIFNEQEIRHKIEKARYWDQVDVPVLDSNWFVMAGLLEENRFFRFEEGVSYESAVAQMAEKLTALGQADPKFLERLQAREQIGTMAFDHAVAIPHTVQYAWNRLVLAIGVFPRPVDYHGQEIRLIFLLGLPEDTASDDGLLIRVYEEIISITRNEELLGNIAGAENFQDLVRTLYRQA